MSKGVKRPVLEAETLARRLSRLLTEHEVKHVVCGSLRRGTKAYIGDIDVVVDNLQKACLATGYGDISLGRKTVNFLWEDMKVNFYVATPEEWGAMMLFLTGNAMFNILTRAHARKHSKGYKLNQYGLWDGSVRVAGRTEEEIFSALGMRHVMPNEREK